MKLLQKHAVLFTLFFTLLLAFAAPYLIPADPDASVFRSGSFGALLIVFGAFTVRRSLEKSDLRTLKYGLFFALIFSFLLGLGTLQAQPSPVPLFLSSVRGMLHADSARQIPGHSQLRL